MVYTFINMSETKEEAEARFALVRKFWDSPEGMLLDMQLRQIDADREREKILAHIRDQPYPTPFQTRAHAYIGTIALLSSLRIG